MSEQINARHRRKAMLATTVARLPEHSSLAEIQESRGNGGSVAVSVDFYDGPFSSVELSETQLRNPGPIRR